MPWNPGVYNEFKEIRYKPFYDLMELIDTGDVKYAVDLGCGTGEQTSILSKKLHNARITGIDSSTEMLNESKRYSTENLLYENKTIRTFLSEASKWDLIFSNAALQWEDNHQALFPRLISLLKPNGQLAVQMPFQKENILNMLLLELINEKPFSEYLQGYTRESPLLTIDDYASLLFQAGLGKINITLKVYPIIAQDEMELFKFISGSALVPYLERLDESQRKLLSSNFVERIRKHFKKFPAIYSFKRLLIYGRKQQS